MEAWENDPIALPQKAGSPWQNDPVVESPKMPDTAPVQKMAQENLAANDNKDDGGETRLPQSSEQRLDTAVGIPVKSLLNPDDTSPIPAPIRQQYTKALQNGSASTFGDFMQTALHTIAPIAAGIAHPVTNAENYAGKVADSAESMVKGGAALLAYPFLSDENKHELLENGTFGPPLTPYKDDANPTVTEKANRALELEQATVGHAMGALYAPVASLLGPAISPAIESSSGEAEKVGVPNEWAQMIPKAIGAGLDVLGGFGIYHGAAELSDARFARKYGDVIPPRRETDSRPSPNQDGETIEGEFSSSERKLLPAPGIWDNHPGSDPVKQAVAKPGTDSSSVTSPQVDQAIAAGTDHKAPSGADFKNVATVTGGALPEKQLHNVFDETGVKPDQVLTDAQHDPSIAADVAAGKVPDAYEHLVEPKPVMPPQKAESLQVVRDEESRSFTVVDKDGDHVSGGFDSAEEAQHYIDDERFKAEERASIEAEKKPTYERPTDLEKTSTADQQVIPGAEKATDATMAQRGTEAALKPTQPQKSADIGLFGDGHKQGELLDVKATPITHVSPQFAEYAKGYPQTIDGMHDAARDWVVENGKKDGIEHAVAIDNKTGNSYEVAKGSSNALTLPESVLKVLKDPNNSITIHHNHPTGEIALSPSDIAILANPGAAQIVAHTHKGGVSAASITDKFRAALANRNAKNPGNMPRELRILANSVFNTVGNISGEEIKPILSGMADIKERTKFATAASHQISEPIPRGMANAGMINYRSSLEHGGFKPDIYAKILDAATEHAKDLLIKNGMDIYDAGNDRLPNGTDKGTRDRVPARDASSTAVNAGDKGSSGVDKTANKPSRVSRNGIVPPSETGKVTPLGAFLRNNGAKFDQNYNLVEMKDENGSVNKYDLGKDRATSLAHEYGYTPERLSIPELENLIKDTDGQHPRAQDADRVAKAREALEAKQNNDIDAVMKVAYDAGIDTDKVKGETDRQHKARLIKELTEYYRKQSLAEELPSHITDTLTEGLESNLRDDLKRTSMTPDQKSDFIDRAYKGQITPQERLRYSRDHSILDSADSLNGRNPLNNLKESIRDLLRDEEGSGPADAMRQAIGAVINTAEKFVGKLTGDTFERLGDAYVRTFQPELVGPLAKRADSYLAKFKAKGQEAENAFYRQSAAEVKRFDKMSSDDRLGWLYDHEVGRWNEVDDPDHARYQALYDAMHKAEQDAIGGETGYKENYLPHQWENPDAVNAFFRSDKMIKKYGADWFKKASEFKLVQEGVRAGFKLKTDNPESMLVARQLASDSMIRTMDLLKDMESSGIAKKASAFSVDKRIAKTEAAIAEVQEKYKTQLADIEKQASLKDDKGNPIGEPVSKKMQNVQKRIDSLNDRLADFKKEKADNKLTPAQMAELKNGFRVIGPDSKVWNVHQQAGPIWKNAVEMKGLWENQGITGDAYRTYMQGKAIWVQAKLGLSLFHPVHVAMINLASGIAGMVDHLIQGGKLSDLALKDTGMGMGLGKDTLKGQDHLAVKAWNTAAKDRTPEQKQMVARMTEGGFVPTMSARDTVHFRANFDKAIAGVGLNNLRLIGTAVSLPGLIMKPFFEHWIPGMKAEIYLRRYQDALNRDPTLANDAGRRGEMARQMAKDTDRTYGEMNNNVQFWNRNVRDSFNASFISGGWKLAQIYNARGLLQPGNIAYKFAKTGKFSKADITFNMLHAYIYTALTLALGGAINVMLGNPLGRAKDTVWDMVKNLVAPQTGEKNPDGTPIRLNQPAFAKESYNLAHEINTKGLLSGSGSFLYHQTLFPGIADTLQNKDFYGHTIISNPTDLHQWASAGWDSIMPISLSNTEKAEAKHSEVGKVAGALGFPIAGAYLNQTPFEQKVLYTYDEQNPDKGDAYSAKLKAQLKSAVVSGNQEKVNDVTQRMKEEGMSDHDIAEAQKIYTKPFIDVAWSKLSVADQHKLIESASPEEKQKFTLKTH